MNTSEFKPLKNKHFQIRIEADLYNDFIKKCEELSINKSDLIRKMIEKFTYEK